MSETYARAAAAVRRHIEAAKNARTGNDLDAVHRAFEDARDVILSVEPAAFETLPREVLTVARNLEPFGDFDSARRLLAVLAQSVGKNTPDAANYLYSALMRRATLSMDVRDYAAAEEDYQHATTMAMQVWGDGSYAADAAMGRVAALSAQDKYAATLPILKRLRVIFRKNLGEADDRYIATISQLGLAYDQIGEYAEAEEFHRDHLRLATYRYGVHHPVTAKALYNLAELARIQGDNAEAEPGFARVLALLRDVAPNSELLAMTLNNYGELLARLDRHDQALPMIRSALEVRESLFGRDSPQAARSLLSLAAVAIETGRSDEARAALERCSALFMRYDDAQGIASTKSLQVQLDLQ